MIPVGLRGNKRETEIIMNTGFLFSATLFNDWRVEFSIPQDERHNQSVRAEFDDWFRVLREVGLRLDHDSLVKPLSELWLGSFRFMEAGMLDEAHLGLIEEVHVLLSELKSSMGHGVDPRMERIIAHLTYYAHKARTLSYPNSDIALAMKPPIVGSVWDITWENLVITPARQSLSMYYKQSETTPFRLSVTDNGFVCERGHEGHWHWRQHAGGRFALQVGGDYPVGWGWYQEEEQQEITVHFYKSAYARAFERMRWVRRG